MNFFLHFNEVDAEECFIPWTFIQLNTAKWQSCTWTQVISTFSSQTLTEEESDNYFIGCIESRLYKSKFFPSVTHFSVHLFFILFLLNMVIEGM